MEGLFEVTVYTCRGEIISCGVQELWTFIRNIAFVFGSIAIPIVIFYVGHRSQRRRLTFELIRSFTNDTYIVDKMQRLFRYRKYTQNPLEFSNPYGSDIDLIWDHIIVLNYFEHICTEIATKSVDTEIAIRGGAATIKGVREVLLARMEDRKICRTEDYPQMISVVESIIRWEDAQKSPVMTEIPEGSG